MSVLSPSDVDEILGRYDVVRCLRRARPLLDLDKGERAWILRAHYLKKPKGGPVYDSDEIADRENTDALLGFTSVLEVVSVAMGEAPPLPPSMSDALSEFLSDECVRRFYEDYYPLALPTVFRLRLKGNLPDAYEETVQASARRATPLPYLISFFELDERVVKSPELGLFLDLLDDYTSEDGEVDLYDVLDLLKDPETFRARFLKPRGGTPTERRALRGFDEFMRFAMEYDALLTRSKEWPLLQSALWLHNCYWFGIGGGSIRFTAQRFQTHLLNWRGAIADPRNKDALDAKIMDAGTLLSNLTNWRVFAEPLVGAASPCLDVWTAAVGDRGKRTLK